MLVFNIRKEKFSEALIASGVANRWNKQDEFVIYTSGSRALSTLELVVHRSSIQADSSYKILTINADVKYKDISTVHETDLPKNWKSIHAYPFLQNIGSNWYQSYSTIILKVPSAIIPQEFNYILHTRHPDFKNKLEILSKEDFSWDSRLF